MNNKNIKALSILVVCTGLIIVSAYLFYEKAQSGSFSKLSSAVNSSVEPSDLVSNASYQNPYTPFYKGPEGVKVNASIFPSRLNYESSGSITDAKPSSGFLDISFKLKMKDVFFPSPRLTQKIYEEIYSSEFTKRYGISSTKYECTQYYDDVNRSVFKVTSRGPKAGPAQITFGSDEPVSCYSIGSRGILEFDGDSFKGSVSDRYYRTKSIEASASQPYVLLLSKEDSQNIPRKVRIKIGLRGDELEQDKNDTDNITLKSKDRIGCHNLHQTGVITEIISGECVTTIEKTLSTNKQQTYYISPLDVGVKTYNMQVHIHSIEVL